MRLPWEEELDANFGLLNILSQRVNIFSIHEITGIIASYQPIEPQTVFWGLNKYHWMQVIDGLHWDFGPNVYDEGLHSADPRRREPGFLKGMEKGSHLVAQTLLQPLTVPFYKLLHKTCWSNHEGPASHMKREEAGTFRQGSVHWAPTAGEFFPVSPQEQASINAAFPKGKDEEEIMKEVAKSDPEFLKLLQDKLDALMAEVEKMSRELGVPVGKSIIALRNAYKIVFIISTKDLDLEALAIQLFDHYEKALAEAPTLLEKIKCILFHYIMCEHIHFFSDGQGRTDRLLFLSGQLCRVGSNPALLDNPYRPCTWTFSHALAHLLNAIVEWQEECGKIHGFGRTPALYDD
jgi:hypothetical protein